MIASNPYAPPQASVQDIADPHAAAVHADRATRLGAAILDGLIGGAMIYAPLLITTGVSGTPAAAAGDANANAMLAAGALLSLVGFVAWCTLTIRYAIRNGQSIAKKILGIKVVRSDGSPISLGRLFWLRNVVNGLISIVPIYGFIEVLFIFGESRQCLHDKIADTIVVRA